MSASVPDATPTPCATPQSCAISASRAAPSRPRINCCDARTLSIAARISSPMAAYCAARSSCGTASSEDVLCVCALIDEFPLLTEHQKSEQKNPEAVHKVPVVGGDFRGDGARDFGLFKFAEGNIQQRADSAEKMQAVQAGKNVKKAAGLVGSHVEARKNELSPCGKLAGQKEHAECRSDEPESAKLRQVAQREPPPRKFDDGAAQKQDRGVHPNEPGKMQRNPAVAAGAQINEGAGHGHEEHDNRDDDDDDCRG